MGRLDRPAIPRQKGNWRTALALALSLTASQQGFAPKDAHAEPAGQHEMLKDKKKRRQIEKEAETRKIIHEFDLALKALKQEEDSLAGRYSTIEKIDLRLKELELEKSGNEVREQTRDESEDGEMIGTIVTLMLEIKMQYPNPQHFIALFVKERDPHMRRKVLAVTTLIKKLLALSPHLKEQQILLELRSSLSAGKRAII